MVRVSLLALAGAALASAASPWPAVYTQKAQAMLAQMTQTEKLAMVHGYGGGYVGDVPANTRLGIPPLNLEDGPQGVADGVTKVTAWPSAATVAMSWNESSMYAFGFGMGQEQFAKGTNVMLGPGVNLARVPWGGRTFEYLGEDPVLAARMVAPEVAGIQANNISACVKHFVDNNQEYDRSGVSENVPQRAQWELYYKAFASAVDAGVGSAMCSYNRINGTWACENSVTLGDLKGPMGFGGWVMSDWGATHSTVPAALGGLDQQMPDASFFGSELAAAIANGTVPQSRLDDMVMRMLVPMYALGLFDYSPANTNRTLSSNATSDAHNAVARELAMDSITLLKNDGGLLPLNPETITSIAIFGDENSVHGYGSGGVIAPYIVTPFQGVYTRLNGPYTPGPRAPNCSFVDGIDFYQPGNPCVSANDQQDCCAKCTADFTCNAFGFVAGATCATHKTLKNRKALLGATKRSQASGGACWLKPNNAGATNKTGIVSGTCPPAPPPAPGRVNVTYFSTQDPVEAAAIAAQFQYALVVVATTSSEGSDRTDLSLPAWQDALVSAVAGANPLTVVDVRCPGACFMPWKEQVPAILYELMPGQESGNSIAATVFGDNNPSGKLPLSFPNSMNDTWLSGGALNGPVNPLQYPGTQRGRGFLEADYSEELLMGYRWYDAMGISPLFPFGHGLSYTTFGYSGLSVVGTVSSSSSATVTFTLTNTGGVTGSEVAQLYIGYPEAANEPPKLLKGFQKVRLNPGQNTAVSIPLGAADLSIYDVTVQGWALVPGTYSVLVGTSSRDIKLLGTLKVTA